MFHVEQIGPPGQREGLQWVAETSPCAIPRMDKAEKSFTLRCVNALIRLLIRSQLTYEVGGESTFLVNIAVAESANQRIVREHITNSQGGAFDEVHAIGSTGRFHRFAGRVGVVDICYEAEVELSPGFHTPGMAREHTLAELPADVIPFLYPSRYCESDKLVRMARRTFGWMHDGHERVCGICNWIYDNVEYLSGSSDTTTSAFDTATERAGVCRDFAHLAIAFCRALGIPARFCSSYAWGLNPPDFHAHFEAWLGGRWLVYDATRLSPESGFVRIGTGRDAADTSVATVTGPVEFQSLAIEVRRLSPAADFPITTSGPLSQSDLFETGGELSGAKQSRFTCLS